MILTLQKLITMKVDKALMGKLENLSRLKLSDQEKESVANDLNNIFKMVEKLEEVDTSNVEPLIYITEQANLLREDEVLNQVDKSKALLNAPDADSDYFKVPTVIKKE